jgi:hypothetical protein
MKATAGPLVCLILLGAIGGLLAQSDQAEAATFTVDRTDDPHPDTADDCTSGPNDCSLRGAIRKANATAITDVINVPIGGYTLTRGGFGITAPLQIIGSKGSGPYAVTLIDANGAGGLFSAINASALFLDRLVMVGVTPNTVISAITSSDQPRADVTVRRSLIVSNEVGVAVSVIRGDLTVIDSSISGNKESTFYGSAIHVDGGQSM